MAHPFFFLLFMIAGTFFLGASDILIKRVLRRGLNEEFLLGINFFFSGTVLLFAVLVTNIPPIGPQFITALFMSAVLNIFAQLAWYRAFAHEDASLISPLRLLSPPITILTGFLILREAPTVVGIGGIFITIAGLWFFLQSEATFAGLRIREVISRSGVRYGFFGALSFAVSFPFDKQAVVNSSALFFAATVLSIIGIVHLFVSIVFRRALQEMSILRLSWKEIVILIVSQSLGSLLTNHALNFALVAYASSVKRLWSLWAVFLSGKFLKERNVKRRLAGALIMFLGILITVLFG